MRAFFSTVIVLIVAIIWALTVATGGAWIEKSWRKNVAMRQQCFSAPATPDAPTSAVSTLTDNPVPLMPAVTSVVTGEKLTLYSYDLLLTRDTGRYKISLSVDGMNVEQHPRYWAITPTTADIGDHALHVTVTDWNDKPIGESNTILRIVPEKIPTYSAARPLNVLIVGDSLIHQSKLPNMLYRKMDAITDGHLRFVGTHHPGKSDIPYYEAALPNVYHEGYGGWGWFLFAHHYKPGEEKLYKISQSPFIFVEDGKPTLDVKRYLEERKLQGPLDIVIFQLGINETFSIDPTKLDIAHAAFNETFSYADTLLQAFRHASPDAYLLLMMPPYFTTSDAAFERQYGEAGAYIANPWRFQTVVRMFNQTMIDRYDGKDKHIILVPTYAVLDAVDDYDPINPSHPNDDGNRAMTETLYGAVVATLQHAKAN